MSENIPVIWTVSDEKTGNQRLSSAVAAAIKNRLHDQNRGIKLVTHIINPEGFRTRLPLSLWGDPKKLLPDNEVGQWMPPWPDMVIGAGRKSAAFTKAMRQWSKGRSLSIQILDPKISAEHFDFVITPEHDGLKGENVLSPIGSPVYFEDVARPLKTVPSPQRAVIIMGGPSKTHNLTDEIAGRLLQDLKCLAESGVQLSITTSRRTPEAFEEKLRLFATGIKAQFWANEARDGPNPYQDFLASADMAVITEDSANMLSDAAYFGLPIHLVKMSGGSKKFDRLVAGFENLGAVRPFTGEGYVWSYKPHRPVLEIADKLIAALKARN